MFKVLTFLVFDFCKNVLMLEMCRVLLIRNTMANVITKETECVSNVSNQTLIHTVQYIKLPVTERDARIQFSTKGKHLTIYFWHC